MSRKFLMPVLSIAGAVLVVLVAVLAFTNASLRQQNVANAAQPQDSEAQPQQQIAVGGTYAWSYAAKFVCGFQSPFAPQGAVLQGGEPQVKAGNYATQVAIHNPNYKEMKIFKKIVLLVDYRNPNQPLIIREPQTAGMVVSDTVILGPDYATVDDCNRIYHWTAPSAALPAFPAPLIMGYLVILSRTELDVDTTYTANAPGVVQDPQSGVVSPTLPTGISIEEERVIPKRVYVPFGALPFP